MMGVGLFLDCFCDSVQLLTLVHVVFIHFLILGVMRSVELIRNIVLCDSINHAESPAGRRDR